jgi:[ribosomal protein S5]-alanine N-acetyltransferase
MSQLPEALETTRLVLRKPTVADAPAMFEAYSRDPQVIRFLAWATHSSPLEAEQYLSERVAEWVNGVRWTYAITLKPRSSMIGHVRLTPTGEGVRIGYALAARFAKQGLVTEALLALIPHAERLSHRFWAYCDTENYGSIRVLEKCGFSLVERRPAWKVFPNVSPEPRDCVLYERRSNGGA